MPCYSGRVWDGSRFFEGHVVVDGGRVTEVGDGIPGDSIRVGCILPGLTDGHTHLGDAGLHLDRRYGLEELVAPPDGLKHRYLRDTPAERIESDMAGYVGILVSSGVSRFLDFREGGIEGVRMLRRASDRAVIFGRPLSGTFDPCEVDALLDEADGIGISSISDVPDSYVSALADATHRRGRHLAIHVSERIREDMEKVISLDPDLVIHMCEATDEDMRALADAGIPVVVCPTSNLYFGKVPPLRRMIDAGLSVSIGTDNAMLCGPDIFAEARLFRQLADEQGCPSSSAVESLLANGNKLLLRRALGVSRGAEMPILTGEDPLSGRL